MTLEDMKHQGKKYGSEVWLFSYVITPCFWIAVKTKYTKKGNTRDWRLHGMCWAGCYLSRWEPFFMTLEDMKHQGKKYGSEVWLFSYVITPCFWIAVKTKYTKKGNTRDWRLHGMCWAGCYLSRWEPFFMTLEDMKHQGKKYGPEVWLLSYIITPCFWIAVKTKYTKKGNTRDWRLHGMCWAGRYLSRWELVFMTLEDMTHQGKKYGSE